jgi:hypothetical protein
VEWMVAQSVLQKSSSSFYLSVFESHSKAAAFYFLNPSGGSDTSLKRTITNIPKAILLCT